MPLIQRHNSNSSLKYPPGLNFSIQQHNMIYFYCSYNTESVTYRQPNFFKTLDNIKFINFSIEIPKRLCSINIFVNKSKTLSLLKLPLTYLYKPSGSKCGRVLKLSRTYETFFWATVMSHLVWHNANITLPYFE